MRNVTIKYKRLTHTYFDGGTVWIDFNGDKITLLTDQYRYVKASEPTLFKHGVISLHDNNDKLIEFYSPSIGYNVPTTILIPFSQKNEYKLALSIFYLSGKLVDRYEE